MRGLRTIALLVGVPLVAAASYGGVTGEHRSAGRSQQAAARRAFEAAFDQRRSLDERLVGIEDGESLRSTFRSIPKDASGVDVASVSARVLDARVHGDKAELRYTLEAPTGELGAIGPPIGVVVRVHGRWKVSRFTMCALIAIAGPPCPGEPHGPNGEPPQFGKPFLPRVRTENGRAVVPVTFPDGTSADVLFPTGVDASGWAVQPALGMRIDDKELVRFSRDELYPSVVQQPDLPPTLSKYRGRGSTHVNVDYLGLMNIHAGKWVVSVDASFMSERQRRALARAVRLSEHDGFPVIEAKAPVELYGREGRPTAAGFAAAPSKGGGGGIGPGASDHAQLQFVPKDEPAPSPDATAAPTDSSGPPQPFPPTVSLASGACKRSDPGELHVDTVGAEPSAPTGGGFEQGDQYPVTVRRCIPGTGIQVEATAFPQLVAAQLAGQTEIRNVRRR